MMVVVDSAVLTVLPIVHYYPVQHHALSRLLLISTSMYYGLNVVPLKGLQVDLNTFAGRTYW